MNKIKTILFSIITILVIMTVTVSAAEPQLQISGDSEAEAGQTKSLNVKLVSEESQGTISGKISFDSNISGITMTGKNNWAFTYNESNGKFVGYKAAGATNEDTVEIQYTLKSDATGKATITLNDLSLTSLNYDSKDIADITKEITIKTKQNEQDQDQEQEQQPTKVTLESIEITKAPNKVKYTEGEKFSKEGLKVIAKYSDGTSKEITNYTYSPSGELKTSDKKIVITYKENEVTKTVEQVITVEKKQEQQQPQQPQQQPQQPQQPQQQQQQTQGSGTQTTVTVVSPGTQKDNTVANKELSKAGVGNIVFYTTIFAVVIGIVFYIKYKGMKDVK